MIGTTTFLAAAAAAGGIAQGYGSYKQSQAMGLKGEYDANQNRINAGRAELQRDAALESGETEAQAVRRNALRTEGAQRAAAASQGIDPDSGTAAALQAETQAISETQRNEIRASKWREAWGYGTEASQDLYAARMGKEAADNEARNTLVTGGFNFASSLARTGYHLKGGV